LEWWLLLTGCIGTKKIALKKTTKSLAIFYTNAEK
jgi:hypothetical protein